MKKALGYLAITILVVTVSIFLGQHSVEFFQSTFAAENQSMGILGYMLTGGGFYLWMIIFLWMSNTQIEKATSLVMMVICLIGELATAIFNMYSRTMVDSGFALTESDIKSMYLLVGALAVAHGVSLVIKFAGQQIADAFKDDDGDGVPNVFDRKDNRPK
jgi:predicted Na+-dependent transporter